MARTSNSKSDACECKRNQDERLREHNRGVAFFDRVEDIAIPQIDLEKDPRNSF